MTSVLPATTAAVAAAPQKASTITQTHPFTCNSCQVAFRSHEQQKTHYHSDWHQYNLKRRISGLPALTSETFAEKVHHAQASTRLERERASFEKLCRACGKVYYSENAYANHVGSLKHRQNVATLELSTLRSGGGSSAGLGTVGGGGGAVGRLMDERDETGSVVSSTFSLGEPIATTEDDVKVLKESDALADEEFAGVVKGLKISAGANGNSPSSRPPTVASNNENVAKPTQSGEEPTDLPVEACLFCPYLSPSLALNVSHMTKAHGLFIPEQSYLADLEGLVRYLGQKLLFGNQCLYCNKTKGGLDGIRTHMRDKGHSMLGFETEEQQVELGQFYDFRNSYSDVEDDEDEELGDYVPRGRRGFKSNVVIRKDGEQGWEGASDDDDGEGWETDSSASSLDSTELCAVPIDSNGGAHHKHGKDKHHMHDGYHVHAHCPRTAVYHDDYELHLPSGRSVGHRSLARYYRQNLRDHPLQDKDVRRIADTQYPRTDYGEEVAVGSDDDEEEGGVVVSVSERPSRRARREQERLAMVSRGNGGLGMVGVAQAKRNEVLAMEKRTREQERRGRGRFEWGVEKRGNMQKHFRDPLLQ